MPRLRTASSLTQLRRQAVVADAWVLALLAVVIAACMPASLDERVGLGGEDEPVAGTDHRGAAGEDPVALLTEVGAAMSDSDLDRLIQLTTDAARVHFVHLRHNRAATGDDGDPFPNLSIDLDPPVVDGDTATVAGRVAYGTAEGAPPRLLTAWRLRRTPDGWRVAGFTRNDEPVERWTVPGDGLAPVRHADIEVAVLALFIDAGCFTGNDEGCPTALRDSFGADLLVTNDTGGDLVPVPVPSPDTEPVPAFVTTSSGVHPVVQADAPGFPSGTTSEVVAVFTGASELSAGGTLHLAFETDAGAVVPFEIPLPAYPHDW